MAIKTSQWLACIMLLSMTSVILAARVSQSMHNYDVGDDHHDKEYVRDLDRGHDAAWYGPYHTQYEVCRGSNGLPALQ